MTHAADILTEAFDYAVEELDGFLARLTAADPVLELEHDGSHWWIVNATSGTWMYRHADLWSCFRFARAFMRKTAGARLGDSLAHIGSAPGTVEQALSGRGQFGAGVAQMGERPQQHMGEVVGSIPAPGLPRPESAFANVGDPMTPLDTVSAAVELLTSQAPVPQAVDGEPASLAGPGVSVAAHAAPPDSFSVRVPSNVIPIGGR